MKKILLFLTLFVLTNSVKPQQTFIIKDAKYLEFNPISNMTMPTKQDTVKAVLLITTCDDCQSESITAFAVRQSYWGNGNTSELAYYEHKEFFNVIGYLDNSKKPFPDSIIIWQSKIK